MMSNIFILFNQKLAYNINITDITIIKLWVLWVLFISCYNN
jgi:hypothetical protein